LETIGKLQKIIKDEEQEVKSHEIKIKNDFNLFV
jgi:hypothetical protein